MILKLIMFCFIVVNIIILAITAYVSHFNPLETAFTYLCLWFFLIKKILLTVLGLFRHPIRMPRYLVLRAISLIMNYIRTDILIFGPIVIELILPTAAVYVLMLPLHWHFLIKIILAYLVVIIIYEGKRTAWIFYRVHNSYRRLYAGACYWHQYFKNAADAIYEDLHHLPHSEKVSPEDRRKSEYENSARSYKDDLEEDEKKKRQKGTGEAGSRSRRRRTGAGDTGSEHAESYGMGMDNAKAGLDRSIRRLNILYGDELKVFGLQGVNFTEDDLKKKYRELAKRYHPDNFPDSEDAKMKEKTLMTVNRAYSILHREIQKMIRNIPSTGDG